MIDTLRGLAPILLPVVNAALLALAAWRIRPAMRNWVIVGSLVLLAPVAAALFAAPAGSGVPLLIGTAADSPMHGAAIRGGGVPAWLSIDGLTLFMALLALATTALALAASSISGGWPRQPVRRAVGAQVALAGCITAVAAVDLWLMVLAVVVQGAALWATLGDRARWRLAAGIGAGALAALIAGVAMMVGEAGSASLAMFAQPPVHGGSDATARTTSVALLLIGLGAFLVLPAMAASRRKPDAEPDAGDAMRSIWLGMLPAITAIGVLIRLMIVAMESPSGFGSALDGVQWTPLIVVIALMLMTTGHVIALMSRRLTPLIGGLALANVGLALCPLATAAAMAHNLLTPIGSEPSLLATDAIAQTIGAAGFWMWIMLLLLVGLVVGSATARLHTGRHDLPALQGIGRRAPWVAVAFVLVLLAQIGVFPTAGFTGRMELLRSAMQSTVAGRLVNNLDNLQQLSLLVGAAFVNIALGVMVGARLGRVLMRRPLPPDTTDPARSAPSTPPGPSVVRNLLLGMAAAGVLVLGLSELWAYSLGDAFRGLRQTAPPPTMEAMPFDPAE